MPILLEDREYFLLLLLAFLLIHNFEWFLILKIKTGKYQAKYLTHIKSQDNTEIS